MSGLSVLAGNMLLSQFQSCYGRVRGAAKPRSYSIHNLHHHHRRLAGRFLTRMVALRALAQSLERVRIPPHQVIVEAARCNCKGYEAVASSAITRATIAPPASIIRIQQGAFSTKAPAKKGKKDKDEGGGGGGGGTAGPPIGDVKTVAPVNIHKDGKDPPLLPDDQYPEWLFNLRPLTLPEYRKIDISKLPLKEQRRYWKLLNRQVIKEKNAAGQKL